MVSWGTWRRVNDRDERTGPHDAVRAHLEALRNACEGRYSLR